MNIYIYIYIKCKDTYLGPEDNDMILLGGLVCLGCVGLGP